ncbi:MAG: KdsC family phosphatase [Ruminococcus sp.]
MECKNIKLLVMDVDGTLTDGCIYCSGQGELFKAFNVKDGYAIAHILPKIDVTPIIITGRKSDIVKYRASELGIKELHQGINNKLIKLKEVAEKYNCSLNNIAYIGDDLNDISCIELCGFTACPADSIPEVIQKVNYVCKNNGGRGAVREFIMLIANNK